GADRSAPRAPGKEGHRCGFQSRWQNRRDGVWRATGRGGARLWDTNTGQPVGRPLPHPGAVLAVALSPDGRTILTGSRGEGMWRREAPLWHAEKGEPRAQPLPHHRWVTAV